MPLMPIKRIPFAAIETIKKAFLIINPRTGINHRRSIFRAWWIHDIIFSTGSAAESMSSLGWMKRLYIVAHYAAFNICFVCRIILTHLERASGAFPDIVINHKWLRCGENVLFCVAG
jgi:hypothetical protein